MRLERQLARINCQTFSMMLNSGHFGGSDSRAMLLGSETSPTMVPSGLIEQRHGVPAGADHLADFG